ncbi:MAG: glycoside hydrolase family 15 protein [Thermoplasmataceae archaeon]
MFKYAPGAPGILPRWTSSAKSGVGTAISFRSRLWYTISHGILNEIYYPRVDQANTRDVEFLVSDGQSFFSEEKRDTKSTIEAFADGVPGFRITNTCKMGKYVISKDVFSDPDRDSLIIKAKFTNFSEKPLRIFILAAPHIKNRGYGNDGWVDLYKGELMLFARREDTAMAIACNPGFRTGSAGYVGQSDGWQELRNNFQLRDHYDRAMNGNVALTGEIDIPEGKGSYEFTIAISFSMSPAAAAITARASLAVDPEIIRNRFVTQWERYLEGIEPLRVKGAGDLYKTSVAVIRTHQSKSVSGGIAASLSIPWGFSKGDFDLGGYHLIWPRDLVESAGGLIASGDINGGLEILSFLVATQEIDGHWPQNMWIDGTPYWTGIQMDEAAFPILLVDLLKEHIKGSGIDPLPMILKAASFIARNGPVTGQDRWEEDSGYSCFTLAAEVAALIVGAEYLRNRGYVSEAAYLEDLADFWNDNIENWTYTTTGKCCTTCDVPGYYVRISPPMKGDSSSPFSGYVPIRNRPPIDATKKPEEIVSPDFLALVRFGLRSPHDQRIVNTIKVVDTMLKTETKTGPVWHRYNDDGYGENPDGTPFNGTGVGRGWPLLAGERAHYELAAGNREEAVRLAKTMENQAGIGGMIPEQVWDADDIPKRGLYNGRPSGSAMPLVWAHAEYIKLLRSLRDGRIFDQPTVVSRRYLEDGRHSMVSIWSFSNKIKQAERGKPLRIQAQSDADLVWTSDNWKTTHNDRLRWNRLDLWSFDIATDYLAGSDTVEFTFFWIGSQSWEGKNFQIRLK